MRIETGRRLDSSPGAVGSLVSCWRSVRPPGAGREDASRRPAAARSPSLASVIPPAVGWDYRDKAIGAAGLDGRIPSTIRESDAAAVHGIRSLDPGILGEWNPPTVRRRDFAKGILVRSTFV